MTKTRFTPGPWFAVGARVLARSKNQLDEDEALSIADVDMDVRIDVDGEGAANAALIAAAPELYEALRDLERTYVSLLRAGYERITELGGDCDPVDKMEAGTTPLLAARAALAKARGETP